MAKIHKPKYSKSEVSQRFNLKELLGYEPSAKQKETFFDLVVEKQQERTTNGKDINGSDFKPYTKEYADKKGVSRTSVDLLDNGEMLSSFKESQTQKNIVKVKMKEGEQTLKAYNHNVGDTLPKRTFFGINDEKDISDVIKQVDSLKEKKAAPIIPRRQEREQVDLAELRREVQAIEIEFDFEDFNGEG